MASPIVPSTGLGSGLNISGIVEALVNADKAAKQGQITRATATNTASISGIAKLQSLLATFQTTIKTLGSTTTPQFNGFAATTTNDKAVTGTATNTAVAGTYVVKVTNLATSSKVASAAFAGGTTSAIPTGDLKISQNGTDYNLSVKSGATLQSVRDSINSDSALKGAGISANIVTDSFGSRLVLGSTTTGAGSDISVSGIAGLEIDGTALMGDTPTATSSGAIGSVALDAKYSVDGLALTSSKNTIDKAVSGLTLNLVAADSVGTTITVAANTDGLKASIQKFVDAYNAVANGITALTKATVNDDGTTTAAAMTGDALPRSILAEIRKPLSEVGAGTTLTVLAQLGITTNQKTGALDFDTTKYATAMNDKKLGSEVQEMFTGDNGLLARMDSATKQFTQGATPTQESILTARSKALSVTKNRLTADQEALDRRIETLTSVLTKKYAAMDTLVGQLKATASNITSMFEALTAQQKG
ncbi:flagellar filament capping protein FliD [Pseudomonas sp. MAFF 302046]|jgi:flagellar hook-associated protein 2|uniref:Flagellar hook-associated protein 2 n=1 Tax=Pseudomonas morbosilactucae TaxID=2938197 RepID=A0ABT0JN72_9PSED|nr:flagellar filament capping protein FliD [Pseudomonas morbosilactucae]MCK9817266.1 flagellar filament capping protein FliD [Pseudomonas morbosilactucae]